MTPLSSPPWDPRFLDRSPLFAPLLPAVSRLQHSVDWPTRSELDNLIVSHSTLSGGGKPLRLIAPQSSSDASRLTYESRCFLSGELEVRESNWHDLFNVLVWLTFPQTKALLNARHYHAQQTVSLPNKRSTACDALTLFDECGVVVTSTDESLLDLLRQFAWKELFWHRRQDMLRDMRIHVFGHGLYEQALRPFIGLTGKAVLLAVEPAFLNRPLALLDQKLTPILANLTHPRELSPLPILGVPGWMEENSHEGFYDNTNYFRPGRSRLSR